MEVWYMLPEVAGPETGWLSSEEELAGCPLRNWSVTCPAGPDRSPSQSPGLFSGGSCSGTRWGRGSGDARTAPGGLSTALG